MSGGNNVSGLCEASGQVLLAYARALRYAEARQQQQALERELRQVEGELAETEALLAEVRGRAARAVGALRVNPVKGGANGEEVNEQPALA